MSLTLRRFDRVSRRLPRPFRRLVERVIAEDIFLLSAGVAFYAVVSLAPLLILSLWLISLFAGERGVEQLASHMERLAPQGIGISDLFRQIADAGTSAGVVAVASSLWPASAYGSGLARAFERLTGEERRILKGVRGRGLLLGLLLPLFVAGGLVGSYAGTAIVDADGAMQIVGAVVAFLTGLAGTFLSTILIYRLFPPDPLHWGGTLKTTAVVSIGIALLSLTSTLYLNLGANFEEHYATSGIGLVVLLGLWLFFANSLLLGGYAVTQPDSRHTASPGGQRDA
jgi:membrane protein